jgi:hypothetical protein
MHGRYSSQMTVFFIKMFVSMFYASRKISLLLCVFIILTFLTMLYELDCHVEPDEVRDKCVSWTGKVGRREPRDLLQVMASPLNFQENQGKLHSEHPP